MLPSGRYCIRCTCKRLKTCLNYLNQVQNINAHCILGYRRKMSEIIQLIRYENNERLGSDCLSDQNDHWNSNLSENRLTYVFIGSFSINDVTIFGCLIDKQHDSLSDLIISFGTAKNQITFYRSKYSNTKIFYYFYLYQHICKIW